MPPTSLMPCLITKKPVKSVIQKMMKYKMIPIPLEYLLELGLGEFDTLQIYVRDGAIVLRRVEETEFVCGGDCEDCPCSENCDESEAN